jgi:hypothetical protein
VTNLGNLYKSAVDHNLMDREAFEMIAQPGDLVLIVSNAEGKGDRLFRRMVLAGIYERAQKEYGSLRSVGHYHPSTSTSNAHGFDFGAALANFSYANVDHLTVAMPKNRVAEHLEEALGAMAGEDFRKY